jgi:hypothetical protein
MQNMSDKLTIFSPAGSKWELMQALRLWLAWQL